MAFGGTWDDNVLLAGTDTAEVLPNDYVTGMTPAGALDYLGPRLVFTSAYQGSFAFYRELSDLNSRDQAARAHMSYRATPYVTVRAGQTFATARETDLVEFVGLPFRRLGSRNALTTGGVEVRLSPRTTMTGGYDFRIVDFDEDTDPGVPFPGGHEHHMSGAVTQRLSERATVGGTYALRRVIVTDDPEAVVIHHAAGTADYQLTEHIGISGSLGLSRLGAVGLLPARTGLAWRGMITARREYFTVNGYYQRTMVPSFGFGGTFENEELVGSISGEFARRRAFWQAGAAWRDNDPLSEDSGPSRRSTWLNSRLGYRFTPWLSLEGYYSLARQNTQREGGIVNRNRVGFQIVTSKPLRMAH
jgi:hypothetical protein